MAKEGFPEIDLQTALAADQLPAMPQTAIRLLEMSRDPAVGPAEFAVPVEADPGLTVQVLRFVNSSYFGFRNEISSVKRAITMVGVPTVKNFALWTAVFSVIPAPHCRQFDLRALWQDSLRRAIFARTVSKLLGLPQAEEAFAAALLQDMAVPLLAKEAPSAYDRLFDARRTSHTRARLSRLEEHVFGWNHAAAAGIVARQWRLPESLSSLIEGHVALDQHLAAKQRDLTKVAVGMSALLPAIDDPQWAEFPRLEACYREIRPLDGPSMEELLGRVDREFAEIAPILRIPMPKTTLAECHRRLLSPVTG
jgi:HD-like signal output (HDOD) protein